MITIAYIDTKYFNIYNSYSDIRIKSSVFEVDDFIAPIISILNQKGYKTEYCCSGHVNDYKFSKEASCPDDNCYILFRSVKNFKNIEIYPQDFILEYNEEYSRFAIRKYYIQDDRFLEIIDTMKELYKWAKELPNIKSKSKLKE